MPLIAKDLATLNSDEFYLQVENNPLRQEHNKQLEEVANQLLKKLRDLSGKDIPKGEELLISDFEDPLKREVRLTEYRQWLVQQLPRFEFEAIEMDFEEFEQIDTFKSEGKLFITACRLRDIVITYKGYLLFHKSATEAYKKRLKQDREQKISEVKELLQSSSDENDTEDNTPIIEEPLHHQADENSTKDTAPTAAQWALFYIYRQQAREIPWFDGGKTTKQAAIKDVFTKNHGNGWKNFRIRYYYQENGTNRVAPNNIANIEKAIKMLDSYPEAQKIAQDELKLAHDKS